MLSLTKAADETTVKDDLDVLFIACYIKISHVAENTRRLIVLVPYTDTLNPSQSMSDWATQGHRGNRGASHGGRNNLQRSPGMGRNL